MSDATRPIPGRFDLGFFGAITASLSHEINNVLAIINELSGLMDDLLAVASQGGSLDPDRFKKTVERIANQVNRGKNHVRHLNRFAHTVDDARTQMDARELFEHIVVVCQRFATLRKVTMNSEQPEQPVPLQGSPFDLQHVIYRGIDVALRSSAQDTSFTVRLEAANDGARVLFTGQDPVQDAQPVQDALLLLRKLSESSGGALEATLETGKPLELVLSLPGALRSLAFSADLSQE
jgi:C4-dicarboxylate-specific signal transduction histidine kinase